MSVRALDLEIEQLLIAHHLDRLSCRKIVFGSAFRLFRGVGTSALNSAMVINGWIPDSSKWQAANRFEIVADTARTAVRSVLAASAHREGERHRRKGRNMTPER